MSSPVLSARTEGEGGRPGSNRYREDHDLACLPLTPRPPRWTAGTTGFEPAASRLTNECSSAELRPLRLHGAGGIRTHGLELMRLARTAAPLPRYLAGRSRTCDLRRPKPAGRPRSPTTRWIEHPRRESNPRLRVEDPASSPFDHGGMRLRRQGSNLRLTGNSRASYRLDHAGVGGRGGSRTPKARRPTRLRGGIPRRWQPFPG